MMLHPTQGVEPRANPLRFNWQQIAAARTERVEKRRGGRRNPRYKRESGHPIPILVAVACHLSESFEEVKKLGLDATDIRILSALQQHGQLSKTKLAELANISPTPCWARLDRLKAAGLVRGYHADIALERICDFTQVMVTASLTHHRKADFDRFEAWVARQDDITECIATGGGMDYVMKTVSPSLGAFQILMQAMLEADMGVDRYMTYIATRVVKAGRPNIAKLAGSVPRDRSA